MPGTPISRLQIADIAIGDGFGKIGFTYHPGETHADEVTPASEPDRRIEHALIERWDAAVLLGEMCRPNTVTGTRSIEGSGDGAMPGSGRWSP